MHTEGMVEVQVLQQSASHLLMAIIEGLLGPYPIGQYSPAPGFDRGQSSEAAASAPAVEAWCTTSSDDPINDNLAPQWHQSSPEEVWQRLRHQSACCVDTRVFV